MTRTEILHTRYGEMLDMIACLAIYQGAAREKRKKLTMEQILELR